MAAYDGQNFEMIFKRNIDTLKLILLDNMDFCNDFTQTRHIGKSEQLSHS